ncbi:hypothetical protein [uncultured Thiodictyon sp.]|uniref:hypothetical protein n=1 Tax=uncultured Thiodictyon sp. TaxID=1846217 RepID=UPI0025D4EAAF|nr:hypothetical protein [uncultured Thiodictyon sp.]
MACARILGVTITSTTTTTTTTTTVLRTFPNGLVSLVNEPFVAKPKGALRRDLP